MNRPPSVAEGTTAGGPEGARCPASGRHAVVAPLLAAHLALAAALLTPPARADCTPESRQSSCVDADSLWVPSAPGPFLSIPTALVPSPGSASVRLAATALSRPIVLTAQSPDPEGREVIVVGEQVSASLALSYVPLRHLAVDVAASLAVHRAGTGLGGVTMQRPEPLSNAAARDLRLGVQHDLVLGGRNRGQEPAGARAPSPDDASRGEDGAGTRGGFSAGTRLDVTLPTGDETAFAGDRGVVTAPSVLLSLARGRVFAGSQLGARLRLPVDLGGARLGTEVVSSLGVGARPVRGPLSVDVAVEAWLLAAPSSASRERADGARSTFTQIGSEWLLSARLRSGETTLALGGGTGIPLSSETRTSAQGAAETSHFAGLGTPRVRGILAVTHGFHAGTP